jgi:hypothetical protein
MSSKGSTLSGHGAESNKPVGKMVSNRAKRITRLAARSTLVLLIFLPIFCSSSAYAQRVADMMVATVDGGGGPELITYSDLLWQIALQPDLTVDNPTSDELNRALNLVISQRLILQEANKLPAIAISPAEVTAEEGRLISLFPSRMEFENRLQRVGLSTDQLHEITRQRVAIRKYLDFRFRSFVVVTPQEEADYYRDVYVPRYRRQYPGRIVPTLEEARSEINHILTESKIDADTDTFIDNARERAEIVILNKI